MFYALMIVTFCVAAAVSFGTAWLFSHPADAILKRVIQDGIYRSWVTYLKFALFVVGISSGVRVNELERFVTAPVYGRNPEVLDLTTPRWVLLIFFVIALIAFVLVRIAEVSRRAQPAQPGTAGAL
jgi:cytochrome bd-type quinol oxidase subunit 2